MNDELPRVWIITDPDHPDGPVTPLRHALEGSPPGMLGVQLRAKHVSDRQLIVWGRELRILTHDAGQIMTVNRRPDVAQIVGADGVHLPELGLPLTSLHKQWPSLGLVGVSRHDRGGLEMAARDRASYAFFSPIFEVPGKLPAIGIHGFRTAIANVGIPTYALGGIRSEDLPALLAAGAFGVAIRRAIYGADQPKRALECFIRALDKGSTNGK
jgi:thiamine-phosphate pyrophosphorylase